MASAILAGHTSTTRKRVSVLIVEQLSQLFRNNWDNCSTLPGSLV